MKTTSPKAIKYATLGSISHGTLKTEDLLSAFIRELEWQIQHNGEFFSNPENFAARNHLNNIASEASDCFAEDGENIEPDKEDTAIELVNETLPDALQEFAAPYCYFGSHCGDGSDFGFWPNIDCAKESVEFVSSITSEYPPDDFQGEWLHINERGNCTLYVRTLSQDKELWSIV